MTWHKTKMRENKKRFEMRKSISFAIFNTNICALIAYFGIDNKSTDESMHIISMKIPNPVDAVDNVFDIRTLDTRTIFKRKHQILLIKKFRGSRPYIVCVRSSKKRYQWRRSENKTWHNLLLSFDHTVCIIRSLVKNRQSHTVILATSTFQ